MNNIVIKSAPSAEQKEDRMSECDSEKSGIGTEDSDDEDDEFDG
jgi:hypothetical protein